MFKKSLAAGSVAFLLVSQAVLAAPLNEHDRSRGNSCAYVHHWYKRTTAPHAVFATSNGESPFASDRKYGVCQAGGGATIAAASAYAIPRCETEAMRLYHKHIRCVVIEKR